MEEKNECEFCGGEGKIEETATYTDSEGRLTIEGTGKFTDCFNCSTPELPDDKELSLEAQRLTQHND